MGVAHTSGSGRATRATVEKAMKASRIRFRIHAIKRMFRRSITDVEVRDVVTHGEVIEDYPTDVPYPAS